MIYSRQQNFHRPKQRSISISVISFLSLQFAVSILYQRSSSSNSYFDNVNLRCTFNSSSSSSFIKISFLFAAWLQSSSKRCFYLRRAQSQSMIQDFFILIFQRVRFFEDLEDCSCFVQLMTLDLISLQFWLLRLRAFKQNSDYHNQYFALLFEI